MTKTKARKICSVCGSTKDVGVYRGIVYCDRHLDQFVTDWVNEYRKSHGLPENKKK